MVALQSAMVLDLRLETALRFGRFEKLWPNARPGSQSYWVQLKLMLGI